MKASCLMAGSCRVDIGRLLELKENRGCHLNEDLRLEETKSLSRGVSNVT